MAQSFDEKMKERVQAQVAATRQQYLDKALDLLDKAGSIAVTAQERIKAGNVGLEDVRALCSAAAMLNGVANNVCKAVETLQVQVSVPEDKKFLLS